MKNTMFPILALLLVCSCQQTESKKPNIGIPLDDLLEKTSDAQSFYYLQEIDSIHTAYPKEDIAKFYMLASDSLENRKFWEAYLLARSKEITLNPKGKKAAESLFKMAENLHLEQNRTAISKFVYKLITEFHEHSKYAEEARQNLDSKHPPTLSQLNDLEEIIYNQVENLKINPLAMKDYILASRLAAAYHPSDSLVVEKLSKSAALYKGNRNFKSSIFQYNWIIHHFPNSKESAEAHFFKAFTLDEEMNNTEEAQKAYTEFIQKFPNHPFVKEAKILKNQLGMSDEEILNQLKANRK